ncbi:hypothetical protein JY651_47710 [Pyxidicoccus parkwayensis]|uniref:Lipoprotein n=1 Tax=Pyxidicoccus parkwayensis TaxID=2813578 RepID=A0ABX7NW60_9BACT|nr:hypothetical protein [Pyxidicoccus parkwaysis]QSQ22708.1 hypothetical protein JY651_47710 [Pyxidicoccus parkwaysis]
MKQGARRWVVGLLAGGALVAAGCRGEWVQERTVTGSRAAAGRPYSESLRMGGTAGPSSMRLSRPPGVFPADVGAGLGTFMAATYRVNAPGGESATGGSGSQGTSTEPGEQGGAAGASGKSKPEKSGGASAGGHGGQQGHE